MARSEKNEKSAMMIETTSSAGWKHIEEWIENKKQEIQTASLNNIINLKSSEFLKWQAYYAGEINIIRHFETFISKSLKTEKPKMKNQLIKKFKDIF